MIIGLAGSFGAGKGAVADYLVKNRDFTHYSMSNFIIEEVRKRGMSEDRDAMTLVANDLRKNHGPTYIIDTLYKRAQEAGEDSVIESLRTKDEVKRIQELGGVVIGVDADPKVRYERTYARGSSKDNVSYEQWLEQERRESNPHDPTKQDIFGALKQADHIILNNSTFEDLYQHINTTLDLINKR